MAHTIDSTLIPRILGGALMVLREQCPLLRHVQKDYNGAASEKGNTIVIHVPVPQTVGAITPSNATPSGSTKSLTPVSVTLATHEGTNFQLTEQDAWKMRVSDFVPGQVKESARAIANSISAALWACYTKVYGYAGTAGTNPFATNVNPAADVEGVLEDQLCPDNGQRKLYLGSVERTAALKLAELKAQYSAGNTDALRMARIGQLFSMEVFKDGNRPTHTAGTSDAATAVKANVAAGLKTFKLKGTGATGTLVVGDIITFAGHSQTYAVQNAVADVSVADTDVTIEPALVSSIAADELIARKATHKVNLAMDPAALALAIRPNKVGYGIEGAEPQGDPVTMVDAQTGIPLTLYVYRQYHQVTYELTAGLYGCGLADGRLAARLAG